MGEDVIARENLETESIDEENSKVSADITSDKTVESDSNHEEEEEEEESQMSVENSHEDSNITSLNEESQDDSKDVPEEKTGRRSKTNWRERHKKREIEKQTVQAEETEDYVFKTKRQRLHEQENEQPDEIHEEIDDDEEIERQRIEAKEREKKQRQHEMRLKRMQALQARSLMQEEVEPEDGNDFYKSWHEKEAEEERLKEAEEQEKHMQRGNIPEDDEVLEEESQSKQQKFVEITDKDLPKRNPEEAEKEGVAKWAKMCEPELNAEPPEVIPAAARAATIGTKDLPSKAQVDAQQEEQQTWQDRWYQNKKVQKTVQQSKFNSKVRTQYKKKFKTDEGADKSAGEAPGTSAKDLKAEALRRKANRNPTAQLPIIGSLDEYSKLPKQKEESQVTASKSSDEDESDNEEGDGLWSAILGKK